MFVVYSRRRRRPLRPYHSPDRSLRSSTTSPYVYSAVIVENKTGPHTHTHPFNGPLSGTTQVSRYQKGKTNLDFTEAKDSEWQWHQLGHMQVYTSLQTDNHASTPPLCFLQAGCPSCRPANSAKALNAKLQHIEITSSSAARPITMRSSHGDLCASRRRRRSGWAACGLWMPAGENMAGVEQMLTRRSCCLLQRPPISTPAS